MAKTQDQSNRPGGSSGSRGSVSRTVVIDPKHRRNVWQRYKTLNQDFSKCRKYLYQQQIQTLNTKLQALIRGDEPGLLEELCDVEEARDEELVRLNGYEKYLLDQAKSEHEQRVALVDSQFQQATKIILDKFEQKLETHVNNGAATPSSFDIAVDSMTELKNGSKRGGNMLSGGLGSTGGSSHRPKLRRREATSSYATNNNTGSGSESAVNSAFEFSRLTFPRDKEFQDDLKFFWSDIDLTTHSGNESATPAYTGSSSSTRNVRSAVKGLVGLKNEEIALDLAQIKQKYN
jgi:hypothetical protein